jgi:hypothetical protein
MRGNEEGSYFLDKPPEQEDTRSSPSSLMELKFKLDTRLTMDIFSGRDTDAQLD